MPYGDLGDAFQGAPSSVLVANNNALTTILSGTPTDFVNVQAGQLQPPAAGYNAKFTGVSDGSMTLEFVGTSGEDYRLDVSGRIVAPLSALSAYIAVELVSDLQSFTGGTKAYPLGISFTGAPEIGFNLTVYGKFSAGERVTLRLASNTSATVTVTDCICFAVQITPAG